MEALRFNTELIDEREIKAVTNKRGDFFGCRRAIAYHDALTGKFLSHALTEFRTEEYFPASSDLLALIVITRIIKIPTAIFAAHRGSFARDLVSEISAALFVEKLNDIAMRELLKCFAGFLYTTVKFFHELVISFSRAS